VRKTLPSVRPMLDPHAAHSTTPNARHQTQASSRPSRIKTEAGYKTNEASERVDAVTAAMPNQEILGDQAAGSAQRVPGYERFVLT
jgi:hypothetical protein